MNVYKIINKENNKTKYFNLDLVKCFLFDEILNTVDFFYSSNDFITTPLTNELIKKLKEMEVLK